MSPASQAGLTPEGRARLVEFRHNQQPTIHFLPCQSGHVRRTGVCLRRVTSWNSLPDSLKNINLTLQTFKRHRKTFFFPSYQHSVAQSIATRAPCTLVTRRFYIRACVQPPPSALNVTLPAFADYLRDPSRSLDILRRDLKTFLFSFY